MSNEDPKITASYRQFKVECAKCGSYLFVEQIRVTAIVIITVKPHECPEDSD